VCAGSMTQVPVDRPGSVVGCVVVTVMRSPSMR
jgi:hypothetical protein